MEELTRIRNERGWSQQRLSEESRVNKATINQIERGKRSPNVDTLEKLARALDVEVAEFFPKAQASLWSVEAQERRDPVSWADLLKCVGGMLQDLEGKYDAAGKNFAELSTLAYLTARAYRASNPKATAPPELVRYLETAEGVLRLGVEMMERRAAEGRANVTSLAEHRRQSRETLDTLQGTA